jgi:REP element-mobilizing transposase RayT
MPPRHDFYGKPHRLPAEAYANQSSTFHLTVRAWPHTVQGAPFRGGVGAAVWAVLRKENELDRVGITAMCLMPDHLHAVVRPNSMDVEKWVAAVKSLTTRAAWSEGWIGRLWQTSFQDRYLRNQREIAEVVSYVWQNPAAAALVANSDAWPWMMVDTER